MKKVLIVDDETISRVTLRSLADWEAYEFTVVDDCTNGRQALQYLQKHRVDLMFVDIKMPEMGGLELLECLQQEGRFPVSIVLSGYNEFNLVREAFRLGAYDYTLKSDLTKAQMNALLQRLNETVFQDIRDKRRFSVAEREFAGVELEPGSYSVAIFQIDHFQKEFSRFSHREELQKSVLETARQIARLAPHAQFRAVSASVYHMYYRIDGLEGPYHESVLSAVRQLQAVWRDYLNLSFSTVVSDATEKTQLQENLSQARPYFKFVPLFGGGGVCPVWLYKKQMLVLQRAKDRYATLLTALFGGKWADFETEKQTLFTRLATLSYEDMSNEVYAVLALLAEKLEACGEDFYSLFPESINYFEKISRLGGGRELSMWLNNFFDWVQDFVGSRRDDSYANTILRAQRFIMENYQNPELTLKSVADYVCLNEKYFTTRFTKETGVTFSHYLTSVRQETAKKLLQTTSLKIYEISERVGYNHVEHFIRTFKKCYGMNPGDYKKQSCRM